MPLIRPYRGVWSGRLLPWVSENEPSRNFSVHRDNLLSPLDSFVICGHSHSRKPKQASLCRGEELCPHLGTNRADGASGATGYTKDQWVQSGRFVLGEEGTARRESVRGL